MKSDCISCMRDGRYHGPWHDNGTVNLLVYLKWVAGHNEPPKNV